jgi:t-SNARE complex subunit (syntaxin)
MPEPEKENDEHMERRVVYETVSSTSTRSNAVTFVIIAVIAIALIVWVVMQMR